MKEGGLLNEGGGAAGLLNEGGGLLNEGGGAAGLLNEGGGSSRLPV